MAASTLRSSLALVTAALVLAAPTRAFYTPLSEQAVREAYFLGQRTDGTYQRQLAKYTKVLTPPKTGPYISSIAFLTPFIQFVEYSSRQFNYSAQQAEKDHNPDEEFVRIEVEIWLTPSYGAHTSESSTPLGYVSRSCDFWREFKYRILDGEEEIATEDVAGQARYFCSKTGCSLVGATIRLQFPAAAFTSASATIEVTPPEGDAVSAAFDLSTLR